MSKRKPAGMSPATYLRIVLLMAVVVGALLWLSRRSWVLPTSGKAGAAREARVSEPRPRSDDRVPRLSATADAVRSNCVPRLALPACADRDFVIVNEEGRYALRYDTACRQAAWVAYLLTHADVHAREAKRKNAFRSDPEVVGRGWPTAVDRDYAGSGYDRGHLLPSADRVGSQAANNATFLLSNISPQLPALNRGVWKRLEEQVRAWAGRYDSLYVVTGGVLHPGLPRMKERVAIPGQFYKAVLVRIDGAYHAVAFLVPNDADVVSDFMAYAVTVDRAEEVAGLDFFAALPDSIERAVESRIDRRIWR